MNNNKLYVISGPSGVGKGTLVEYMLKRVPNISRSISVTTRKPRAGEIDGIHYHFVSKSEFNENVETGKFLEWAEVHNNLYGTLQETVDRGLTRGQDVVLVIDIQGGLKVKQKRPEAVLIFIEPPTFKELGKRLSERGTEVGDVIRKRMDRAKEELKYAPQYNYKVVNDNLDEAVDDLVSIILNEREKN